MYIFDGYEVIRNCIAEIDINCIRESLHEINLGGAGTRNGLSAPVIRKMGVNCQAILCEKGLLKQEDSIISCIILPRQRHSAH